MTDESAALVLRCQEVPEQPPAKRARKPTPAICLHCWQPIVPLSGHADLVGGWGHRPDCPDRGVEPGTPELFGRWLYAEPGWATPVALCDACGERAQTDVGDDENFVVMPA